MAKEKAKRFTDLIVWQKAHKFVLAVYRFTAGFPKEEVYGLTSQLRRTTVSIAANIAEGFKKTGAADKIRFLNISQGSLEECRYYLMLANDLRYGSAGKLQEQVDEVGRLLAGYSSAVRKNN
ncbi:MAG: four helix bundle protein [Planctomycetota bacterium]|jgi:four helix bundle protein